MSIEVKETWSAISAGNQQARRTYTVTGTTEPLTAAAAVAGINTKYALTGAGARLLAQEPVAYADGSRSRWRVEVSFSIPQGGNGAEHKKVLVNPLDEPVEFWQEPVEISVNRDLDMDGRPVVSSAGNPAEPMPLTVYATRYHFEKNYASFDYAWQETWKGADNDAPVVLIGKTLPAYHCLCEQCELIGKYTSASTHVRVHWSFLGVSTGILGPRPFQYRFMDTDTHGWVFKTGTSGETIKARPFTTSGEAVSKQIRLNGTGIPMACEGEVKVSRVTNPTADYKDFKVESVAAQPNPQPPTYLLTQDYSEAGKVVARWNILRKVKTASFVGIPIYEGATPPP